MAVTMLQICEKTMIYNTNADLVNDNMYTKFGLNRSIRFQDIEQKLLNSDVAVLVTCKNEEDPIKNEGARVLTTLYINFSDAQGQITLVSGRNLNSSKPSCMSSLPVKMKMI